MVLVNGDVETSNPASRASPYRGASAYDSRDDYGSSDALAPGGDRFKQSDFSSRRLADVKSKKVTRATNRLAAVGSISPASPGAPDVDVEDDSPRTPVDDTAAVESKSASVRICGRRVNSNSFSSGPSPFLVGGLGMLLLGAVLLRKEDASERPPFTLHLLDDPTSQALNAVCLDGSPAAIYIKPAASGFETSWQLYLEGGGWCWTPQDCAARATTDLGSSLNYAATISSMGTGLQSSWCNINPTFCNFNQVFVKYCDGNSFSGNRADALHVPATANSPEGTIQFRGAAIIDAALQLLLSQNGLGQAQQVLLTGCSAGGVAAFLQANRVGDFLEANTQPGLRYKVVPVSGFFIEHHNALGQNVFEHQIQILFELSNAIDGVDPACIAAQSTGQEWRCNFAGPAYAHVKAPVFVMDSSLDASQLSCTLTATPLTPDSDTQYPISRSHCAKLDGWSCGAFGKISQCDAPHMRVLVAHQHSFIEQLTAVSTYTLPQNSAFIHSCHTHCGGGGTYAAGHGDDMWGTVEIEGVVMRNAVSTWWDGGTQLLLSPCFRSPEDGGGACNPSCPAEF